METYSLSSILNAVGEKAQMEVRKSLRADDGIISTKVGNPVFHFGCRAMFTVYVRTRKEEYTAKIACDVRFCEPDVCRAVEDR